MRLNEQSEPRFEGSVFDVIGIIRRDNKRENKKIGENMRLNEQSELLDS